MNDLKLLHILVADDNPEWIKPLVKVLDEKYDIYVATDGAEALAMFNEMAFDLVVSDVMMPKMSGLDLLREIRQIDTTVPVIIISGYLQDHHREEARRFRAHAVFNKPLRAEEFINTIDTACNQHSRVADPEEV